MQVTITKVAPQSVVLSAGGHEVEAMWQGELPAVGAALSVELDVETTMTWGVDIVPEAQEPALEGRKVAGTLENYLADESMALVRTPMGLLQVETSGEPPPDGTAVVLSAAALVACDANL